MLHSAAAVVRTGSGGKFEARQLQSTLYFSPSARTATTPCWNATNNCLMFWSLSFIPLNVYKCYSKAGTYTQRAHAQYTLLLIHKSTRRVLMDTDWMRATLRCHSPHPMWPIRSRLLFIPSALRFSSESDCSTGSFLPHCVCSSGQRSVDTINKDNVML